MIIPGAEIDGAGVAEGAAGIVDVEIARCGGSQGQRAAIGEGGARSVRVVKVIVAGRKRRGAGVAEPAVLDIEARSGRRRAASRSAGRGRLSKARCGTASDREITVLDAVNSTGEGAGAGVDREPSTARAGHKVIGTGKGTRIEGRRTAEGHPVGAAGFDRVLRGAAGVADAANAAVGVEIHAARRGAGQAAGIDVDRRGAGLERSAAVSVDRQRAGVEVKIYPCVEADIGSGDRQTAAVQTIIRIGGRVAAKSSGAAADP